MCRGNAHAPAALAVLALLLIVATPAGAAFDAAATDGRDNVTLDIDIGAADEIPADLFMPTPLAVAPVPPEPHEAPVVVPLPPALGPGLAGLGTLAAMHVVRRVYRRR